MICISKDDSNRIQRGELKYVQSYFHLFESIIISFTFGKPFNNTMCIIQRISYLSLRLGFYLSDTTYYCPRLFDMSDEKTIHYIHYSYIKIPKLRDYLNSHIHSTITATMLIKVVASGECRVRIIFSLNNFTYSPRSELMEVRHLK